ncbi:MAG: hypothetical protein KDA17_05710, partial [Candidatus Saccharibacteria bacterium]|nr:hypothetical protein [Candidatus Saccharibacteria bacterium]
MAGETLDIYDYIKPDKAATAISEMYLLYDVKRANLVSKWKELQSYVFATDTTTTTNSRLPWSNKTTIPKLCQIRDNLLSNYMATMFPRSRWLQWLGDTETDSKDKVRSNIETYMSWAIQRGNFLEEAAKCVLDYIDYGNALAMPVWIDRRIVDANGEKTGFVGPGIKRINPVDLHVNPIASEFTKAPKIIRSVMTIGEAKKIVDSQQNPDVREEAKLAFDYMMSTRANFSQFGGHSGQFTAGGQDLKDTVFNMQGFDDWRGYLGSDYVELLTFYGDYFDRETSTLHENQIVVVVDRHKILYRKPNPSVYGYPPIFHAGWRVRQDNLWAMGPLE